MKSNDVFAIDANYQMMFDQMNQMRLKIDIDKSHDWDEKRKKM